MDVQRFRKHSRPGVRYVAWQVGTALDPYPDWVADLIKAGRAKDTDHGLQVQTITGNWRRVDEGQWVVLEETPGPTWIWEMNAEDFSRMFYEV